VSADSAVAIALVFPELLGTYGDRGNAVVLGRRLAWRGLACTLLEVAVGDAVPESCDIYLLGGGEDDPQSEAADELLAGGGLPRAVERGATVLAVCAGFQIAGTTFQTASRVRRRGLGLVDCETVRDDEHRAVGEALVQSGLAGDRALVSGFENHAGRTRRGPGVAPLGRVLCGIGNGDGTEGALAGRVIGTYLHGPVLARNPALADLVLGHVVGPLGPIDDRDSERLRASRARAARPGRRAPWRIGR
jgi:CobQ-like glutamine amidotransferase family enzyme